MCSFYAYVYVFYDFTFCLSVLFSLFCKHVCLSSVFLNKLTYLQAVVLLIVHRVSKNVPPLDCYNFDTHEWIMIFLAEMLPVK